ncbi:hypothetical protein MVES1_002118 [Malassezia vespertilionis]|nr:uncharacterized protein MVES1_002118 [Malassezia vespertilionis]WFD06764.1 hypothetical protein MVES1_002118 [Malassezia vespertilionis]
MQDVRKELSHLVSHSKDALDTTTDALCIETARVLSKRDDAHDARIWRELHTMFFSTLGALLRDAQFEHAVRCVASLAKLAPGVPLAPKHARLVLRTLAHAPPSHFACAWRATRLLLPQVTPSETRAAIRTLLHVNRVGDAIQIFQWHVRRFWRHDAPPPSHQLMHNIMIQMRYLAFAQSAPCIEMQYTDALAKLAALLRENCVPLPGTREDIAWLIKLLYTYTPCNLPATWHAQRAKLVIRRTLPLLVHRIPTHAPPSYPPSPARPRDRRLFLLPPFSARAYNALVQYTLRYAKRPHWCRIVLEHMTHARNPSLAPSPATITILLQQATRRRAETLGAYALELGAAMESAERHGASNSPHLSAARILTHLESAIVLSDTHRVLALVQHICTMHLRTQTRPNGVRLASVVFRLCPELRRAQRVLVAPSAAMDPRIELAVLQLAARRGSITMALRIWHVLKHRHALPQDPVSLAAATVVMQLLACSAHRMRRIPRAQRARQFPRKHARALAMQEYEWLLRHWSAAGAVPDAKFFRAVLCVLARTAHVRDAAHVRVRTDMHTLGINAQNIPTRTN